MEENDRPRGRGFGRPDRHAGEVEAAMADLVEKGTGFCGHTVRGSESGIMIFVYLQ